jgi:hypothetical protein
MSFTFKRTDTIAATVNVELPTDDPRKPNKGSFVCRYKNLTREQMTALQEDLKAKDLTDEQFLDAYLVSVSGIGGADGELKPDEQRKLIYAEPALTLAVVSAFFPALMGAKAKN